MNRFTMAYPLTSLIIMMTFAVSMSQADTTKLQERPLEVISTQDKGLDEVSVRRQHWSLSEAEWSRYQTLMQGLRGSISPANISPIEVLGTHARSEQERRRYAEIWAKMRHDDAERILAFQRAYDEAFKKLYPNEQLIDVRRLNLKHQTNLEAGSRLVVFIKTERCPECDQLIHRLMLNQAVKAHQIDIFFIDTQPKQDDQKIRQWAKRHAIDQKRLKAGTITLNHDQGHLYKITQQVIAPVPQVFKINGQTATALKL